MYVDKCKNSTFIKNCYPPEEIDKKLHEVYLHFFHIDNDVKPDDVNDPVKPFLKNNQFLFTSEGFLRIYSWITEIKIFTDKDLVFSNFEESKTFKFTGTSFSNELRKDFVENSLAQVSLIVSGDTQIYYRGYKKLLEIITSIGGFINGITYTVILLLHIYSKNTILWHCISKILSENEISDRLNKSIIEKNKLFKPDMNKESNINSRNQNDLNISRNSNNSRSSNNSNFGKNDNESISKQIDKTENNLNQIKNNEIINKPMDNNLQNLQVNNYLSNVSQGQNRNRENFNINQQ